MENYLRDYLQERETEAIKLILNSNSILGGNQDFFFNHGLNPPNSWLLINLPNDKRGEKPGDIDILGGIISFNEESKHFYFSSNYLAGIEVKCAVYSEDEEIKSGKGSLNKIRKIQDQVNGLLKMGFDMVSLLDVIANPPANGNDLKAWINASFTSEKSEEKMKSILEIRMAEEDKPYAGHWVYSLGAVNGGYEDSRGTGLIKPLKPCNENLLKNKKGIRSRRKEFNKYIDGIFGNLDLLSIPIPIEYKILRESPNFEPSEEEFNKDKHRFICYNPPTPIKINPNAKKTGSFLVFPQWICDINKNIYELRINER